MILIISVCKQELHELEFVKPIVDIVKDCKVVHYSKLKKNDLDSADKVIICGTSLKDNYFLKDLDKFSWLKTFNKPVLGICAGMQIIGLVFGGKLKKKKEIGYFKENLNGFFGFNEVEVYHLHGNYVEFSKDFKVFNKGIPQAVQYKNFYGVLFHPEVRQKELIRRLMVID